MPRGHGSSEGHVVHKRCEIYHAIEHAELVAKMYFLSKFIDGLFCKIRFSDRAIFSS